MSKRQTEENCRDRIRKKIEKEKKVSIERRTSDRSTKQQLNACKKKFKKLVILKHRLKKCMLVTTVQKKENCCTGAEVVGLGCTRSVAGGTFLMVTCVMCFNVLCLPIILYKENAILGYFYC